MAVSTTWYNRNNQRVTYPHPFFRLDSYAMPGSIKELFAWIRALFYGDAMVGSIIYKLAEYPTTPVIVDDDSPTVRAKWEAVLNGPLDFDTAQILLNLDAFAYGNALCSLFRPFTRFLSCEKCGSEVRADSRGLKFKVKAKGTAGLRAVGHSCTKCGCVAHRIRDVRHEDPSGVRIVRYDPNDISIHYNPTSGRHTYFWRPPGNLRREVTSQRRDVLIDTPKAVLEAILRNKHIRFRDGKIFHFKRPALADSEMGWGKPLLLHSLKRVFYLNILRKAQEQIAIEHIVPLDILFPAQPGGTSPYSTVSMRMVSQEIQRALEIHKQDRSFKAVFPIPIGNSRVGGDGRALLLGSEVDSVISEIAAGMGVPRELVFGGLSWSGSSVSLRVLENHFLVQRRQMGRFLEWLKRSLRAQYGLPDTNLRLSDFKMADDVQRKQLFLQANAANKISTKTLLQELGLDPDKEAKALQEELQEQAELNQKMTVAQARAQGEAMMVQTQFQAQTQAVLAKSEVTAGAEQKELLKRVAPLQFQAMEAQEKAQAIQASMQLQQLEQQAHMMELEAAGLLPPGASAGGGLPPEQGMGGEPPPGEVPPEEELPPEDQGAGAEQGMAPGEHMGGGILSLPDPEAQAVSWASRLGDMDPVTRLQYEQQIQTHYPEMWRMMAPHMVAGVDMRPLPEQAPPRRDSAMI